MTGSLVPLVGAERAGQALDDAIRDAPADHVEVFLTSRTGSVLRFAGPRVHQPQDLTSMQVMARAVVGGRSARAAGSSVAAARAAVARACEQARALAAASRRGGDAHPPAAADPDTGPAESLWSPATAEWDAGARADLLAGVVATAQRADVALWGAIGASAVELAVATSRGVRRYAAATEAGLSLTGEASGGSTHRENLGRDVTELEVGALMAQVVDDALRMREPVELPAGRYDVVFGPLATGELVSFLPAFGFTAPAVAAGVGAVVRGGRSLSPAVTIADDATAGPGLPFPFDMEGTSKRRVELVRAGQLADVVSDLGSADVTGGSTGHAHVAREELPAPVAANLRLEPGTDSTAELIAGIETGVFVERLWYTRVVDATAGTITGTTRDAGWLIRDGRRSTPLRGTRFTESVLDALSRVDGVGRDCLTHSLMNVWNGAVTAPAIRVRGFRLGSPGAAPTGEVGSA